MKARSWLIFPLLLGSIAVAARCLPTEEAEKGAEWEKDRVDRPPVKASFVPAPGFLVISGHSRIRITKRKTGYNQYKKPNQQGSRFFFFSHRPSAGIKHH